MDATESWYQNPARRPLLKQPDTVSVKVTGILSVEVNKVCFSDFITFAFQLPVYEPKP